MAAALAKMAAIMPKRSRNRSVSIGEAPRDAITLQRLQRSSTPSPVSIDDLPLATPRDALASWDATQRISKANSGLPVDDSVPFAASAALVVASRNGETARVKEMIAAKANLEHTDDHGNTALIWGAINGHEGIVYTLLAAGANPAAMNETGRTALHIAWHTQSTAFNRLLQSATLVRRRRLLAVAMHAVRLLAWLRRARERAYAPGGRGYDAARASFQSAAVPVA